MSNATPLAYKITFGPGSTEVTYTLVLPKFDPLLGTLNSVTLYFSGSETSSNFTVANNASITETFDISVTSNLVKNFNNSATIADNFTGETLQLFDTGIGTGLGNCSANPSSTVLPNNGCNSLTMASGASMNFAPFTIHNTNSVFGLPTGTGTLGVFGVVKVSASLASYLATPLSTTFALTGRTQGIASYADGGRNETITQATTAVFAAEVDYNYTPASTPEPPA